MFNDSLKKKKTPTEDLYFSFLQETPPVWLHEVKQHCNIQELF